MPGSRVEPRTAGLSSRPARKRVGIAEQVDGDASAARSQHLAPHLDDGGARNQQSHEQRPDEDAHHEGDGRVDGGEHERGHRRDEGGADEHPERWAQSLAIAAVAVECGASACCLLHYPRCVTETVDVPIIAPDVPTYAHPGDAGADLIASESVRLEPGRRALVGTGVRIALPDGFVAFVVPRSGLAAKHGITVVNSPGTVDAGYRGEIKVTLLNTDLDSAYDVVAGDRIAQLIVMPVPRAHFIPVQTLPESARGEGGFGSTGYQKDGLPA